MRRIPAFATLLLAGCATAPEPAPPPAPVVVAPRPQVRSTLIGMTASELAQRFGTPALQIREGRSTKLQFRSQSCVLDAYLYPPPGGQGPERVAHVDARLRSGADVDQARCISAFLAP